MSEALLSFSVLALWGVFVFAWATCVERRGGRSHSPLSASAVLTALGVAGYTATIRPTHEAQLAAAACIALLAAAPVDARSGYLFDALTMPACLAVLGLALAFGFETRAASGVVLLVGAFGAVVWASGGRLMGLGDVKAMYAIGAAFGPFESLVAIFAACVSGMLALAIRGGLRRGAEVRFGPHLAAGAVVALVIGEPLVRVLTGM